MNEMMPLLLAALLVWAGLFSFLMALEARVRALEARLDMRSDDTSGDEVDVDETGINGSSSDNDENKNGGSSSEVV